MKWKLWIVWLHTNFLFDFVWWWAQAGFTVSCCIDSHYTELPLRILGKVGDREEGISAGVVIDSAPHISSLGPLLHNITYKKR